MRSTPVAPTAPHAALHNAARWVRSNLFSGWFNGLLTVVVLGLLYVVIRGSLGWAFGSAQWAVIPANLHLLFVGTYPSELTWRVRLAVLIIAVPIGLSAGVWRDLPQRFAAALCVIAVALQFLPWQPTTRLWLGALVILVGSGFWLGRGRAWARPIAVGWLVAFFAALVVIHGFADTGPWERVTTHDWGGLLLTLILAISGIALSFPLGIVLALGRRSELPAVSGICTIYIEVMRGVPLIAVLFMAELLLPIFLPGFRIANVIRAIIGMTLFEAAYIAENVRGGLQGIPRGQIEAARALGLPAWPTLTRIVLPQALRAVIPANIGQFISLFKDTSLVAILGLLDFLGIGQGITANPKWLGRQAEVFAFAALIYWMFTFSMSYAGRRIEAALGVGKR